MRTKEIVCTYYKDKTMAFQKQIGLPVFLEQFLDRCHIAQGRR